MNWKVLPPLQFHKLIHHIAPNVIKLKYYVSYNDHQLDPIIKPQWKTLHQFNLPALTELDLLGYEIPQTMIYGFLSCKNLKRLTYQCHRSSDWAMLSELITSKTWPKLEYLRLKRHSSSDSGDTLTFKTLFLTHRQQARISVSIYDTFGHKRPWDSPFRNLFDTGIL